MSDETTPIAELRKKIVEFVTARDWRRFHSPKNLSMALAVEAAELLELFQWSTEAETTKDHITPATSSRVKEEIADVLIYALNLCEVLEIDASDAILEKLEQNAKKYPV
jgi:dCTP diphosphatase